jgi:hypothetical protein
MLADIGKLHTAHEPKSEPHVSANHDAVVPGRLERFRSGDEVRAKASIPVLRISKLATCPRFISDKEVDPVEPHLAGVGPRRSIDRFDDEGGVAVVAAEAALSISARSSSRFNVRLPLFTIARMTATPISTSVSALQSPA